MSRSQARLWPPVLLPFYLAEAGYLWYLAVMGIIAWIVLGLIAGALAKFIMPGKDPGGCLVTMVIGVLGGVLGGFLGTFIGLGKIQSLDLGGILIATAGSILLLLLYRLFQKKAP